MAIVNVSAQIDGRGGQTNWIRNPRGDGAVIGSKLPTFWSSALPSGIFETVVGAGVDQVSGLPYVDIRYNGTLFSDDSLVLYVEPSTYSIAAPGDSFTATAWLGMPAGSLTSVGTIYYVVTMSGGITLNVTPAGPAFTRFSGSGTIGTDGTTVGLCYFELFLVAGVVDITMRLGGFQLERGPVRTPIILPPSGAPAISSRGLLAIPNPGAAQAHALIAGRSGMRVDPGPQILLTRATLSGQGGVGSIAGVPGQAYGGTLIAGSGRVIEKIGARLHQDAVIHGVGSLGANPHGRVPALVSHFGGVGGVHATAFALRPALARLVGLGGRSANPTVTRPAASIIRGIGALQSGAPIARSAAARIDGQGRLRATIYDQLPVIRGVGHVTATATMAWRAQAYIAGSGSLNEIPVRILQASARIAGSGYFEPNLDHNRPARATIQGTGLLRSHAATGYPATAIIQGLGHVGANASPNRPASATIHGAGGLHATARAFQSASAIIRGLAASHALARVAHPAAAAIHGLGSVQDQGHVPSHYQGAATIHGAGSLLVTARGLRFAHANIAGTASLRATGRLLAVVRAMLAGLGHVRSNALPWGRAHIGGTGTVRVQGRRVVPAGARINGRGAHTLLARVAHPGKALIAGAGRVRLRPNYNAAARIQIHGAGTVISHEVERTFIHFAQTHIAGQGGIRTDPYLMGNRNALYGVHLPPIKRSAYV